MSNTEDTPNTLKHVFAGDIQAAKVTEAPLSRQAIQGYGPKIPTGYMLQSYGPRPVWRRVYVMNYGNAGSAYVLISGAVHFLSPGVELILETVRDGGTLEGARAKMAGWPEWMLEAEGLQAADLTAAIPARLEQLRAALDAEDISTGELIELQGLALHIQPGDVQLLEAAGVPEFPEDEPAPALQIQRPADTPLQRRIATGHEARTGHPLDVVQVSSDGMLWHTVRRCCGEDVPAAVATWQDVTPAPEVPAPAPAYAVGQTVKLLDTHPGDGGWSSAYIEGTYGSQYRVRVQGHTLYTVPASKLEPLQ